MSARACEQCGGSLKHIAPARIAKARFCDAACRRAWHREHGAPTAAPPIAWPGVTRRELAAALGVTTRTIERYMAAGLPHVRLRNGRPRFDLSSCLEWQRRPVESMRLEPASCSTCGYAVHVDGHRIAAPLPSCACGAGPLHLVGCGS